MRGFGYGDDGGDKPLTRNYGGGDRKSIEMRYRGSDERSSWLNKPASMEIRTSGGIMEVVYAIEHCFLAGPIGVGSTGEFVKG